MLSKSSKRKLGSVHYIEVRYIKIWVYNLFFLLLGFHLIRGICWSEKFHRIIFPIITAITFGVLFFDRDLYHIDFGSIRYCQIRMETIAKIIDFQVWGICNYNLLIHINYYFSDDKNGWQIEFISTQFDIIQQYGWCCMYIFWIHNFFSSNWYNYFWKKNSLWFIYFLQDLKHEMTTWKILNLCRSIAVIFGWLIVSLRPNTDLLYKNLEKLSNYNTPPSAVYKSAWNKMILK